MEDGKGGVEDNEDRNHKSDQARGSGRREEEVRKSSSHRRQTEVCWIGLVRGQTIPGE